MSEEPFVLTSIDRARDWVDVCHNAIGVPKEKAAAMLASLCGFGSWDIMVFGIESLPPSVVDEKLPAAEAEGRLQRQALRLISTHNIEPVLAFILLSKISPTSSRPIEPFTLDDDVDADNPSVKAMHSTFRRLEESCVGPAAARVKAEIQFGVPIAENRQEQAFSLCGDPEPAQWGAIFEYLGWDFELYEDEPEIDEPSYLLSDTELGRIPVYLTSWTGAPPTATKGLDPSIRLQRSVCVGNFTQHWMQDSKVALLLNRWPQVNGTDSGRVLCLLGSAYLRESNEWISLLFNKHCTSVGELLSRNRLVTDVAEGSGDLDDLGCEILDLATIVLSGYEPEMVKEGEFELTHGTDEESGWCMHKLIARGDGSGL